MAEKQREAVSSFFCSVSAAWQLGQPLVQLSIIILRWNFSPYRAKERNQCHLTWLQQGLSLRDYIKYIYLGREILTGPVSVLRAAFLRVSLQSSHLPRRHHSTWPVFSAPLDVASCARLLQRSERSQWPLCKEGIVVTVQVLAEEGSLLRQKMRETLIISFAPLQADSCFYIKYWRTLGSENLNLI